MILIQKAIVSSNGSNSIKIITGGGNSDIILDPDGLGSVQACGGIKFNAVGSNDNDYVLLKSNSGLSGTLDLTLPSSDGIGSSITN